MNKEKNQRCVPDSYKAYFVGFNFLAEFVFVFHIGRNFFREIQLQSIRSFMFQQTMPAEQFLWHLKNLYSGGNITMSFPDIELTNRIRSVHELNINKNIRISRESIPLSPRSCRSDQLIDCSLNFREV